MEMEFDCRLKVIDAFNIVILLRYSTCCNVDNFLIRRNFEISTQINSLWSIRFCLKVWG